MLRRMKRMDILIHEIISDHQELFNVVFPRDGCFSAYSFGHERMSPSETSLQPGMVFIEINPESNEYDRKRLHM